MILEHLTVSKVMMKSCQNRKGGNLKGSPRPNLGNSEYQINNGNSG